MILIKDFLHDKNSVKFQSIKVGNRNKISIEGSDYEMWIADSELGAQENFNDFNNYTKFIRLYQIKIHLEYKIINMGKCLVKRKTTTIPSDYSSYEYLEMLKCFNLVSSYFYFISLDIRDFGYILSGKNKIYLLNNFSNLINRPTNILNQFCHFSCNCGKYLFQNLDFLLDKEKKNAFCYECKDLELEKNHDYISSINKGGL